MDIFVNSSVESERSTNGPYKFYLTHCGRGTSQSHLSLYIFWFIQMAEISLFILACAVRYMFCIFILQLLLLHVDNLPLIKTKS